MNNSQRILKAVALALAAILTFSADATTVIWNGPATTNTANNWSVGANWLSGTAPIATDDVKFFDAGAVPGTIPTITNINNTVDVSTNIGSLLYGNTNGFHTTLIADGATLMVNSNLEVATLVTETVARTPYAAVTGNGGTLIVSNRNAWLAAKQGSVASARATLDLTGLGTFQATVKGVAIGTTGVSPNQAPGTATFETGTILLGKTNLITAVLVPASYISGSESIEVGYNGASSAGGANFLYLGLTNAIYANSIRVGGTKGTSALMAFNPAFTNQNPTAVFRGTNGGSTRLQFWSAGDMGQRGSSSGNIPGTNDFTFGTLDAMVDQMILGQDPVSSDATVITTANPCTGVLKYNAGTLDVNTLVLGNQQSTATRSSTSPLVGKVLINGNATLKVNTVLKMGYTYSAVNAAALGTFGQLFVTNGTILANSITVSTNTTSVNNAISLTSSTLIVSNAFATSAYPLTNFATANSMIGLKISNDAAAKVFAGNLTTAGTTNVIQLDATPVFFASYPTQFALIKFASLNANNFGLTNLPSWAGGATLVSNGVNKSIDVLLPSDPRPIITSQPATYSGSPGDNVTFSVTIGSGSVMPLSYQWYRNGVAVTDGATGNGSINSGATTASLSINNAQAADSASAPGYTVIVTNAYGTATSAAAVLTISAGNIAPTITGPNNLTVIQSSNATFAASVAGNPAPTIQWQRNGVDISGETSPSYTLSNAQYPADNGVVFSIVATNVAGSTTNYATLTVIVPPAITNQPVNLAVTNTQSAVFTVGASGIPAASYQWYFNGNPISGATSSSLNIANASPTNIGTYYALAQNAAGSAPSSNVTLTVNSLMGVTALSPTNGATGLCYDTPLTVTFSTPPVLRKAGTIKIYNSTNSTTPVDTIDLSLNRDNANGGAGPLNIALNIQPRTIGGIPFSNFPVIITGNIAAIYPHSGVMTSNQTYYVTIDDGCFTDTNGAYFAGISSSAIWGFSTKPTGPANATNIVVAADGTGDFATVQGAVDFIPANNTAYTLVNIRNGTYTEIVCVQGKNNITFRGQNRNAARIAYANNNNMNSGFSGQQTCSTFRLNANDISIENLTVTNTTPQGGSQAFALQVGNGSLRFISLNAEIDSYQDTILVANPPSTAYFRDSLIQGDVDYIWGGAAMFFTNCEMRTLRTTGGYVTNPRAPAGSNGISFVKCSFTVPSSTYSNSVFARAINVANGNTALINCRIDTNAYTGWLATDVTNPALNLRWWEYGNSNLNATASATFNGTQLAANDPNLTNARNAMLWLNGWGPQLAPNILTNPVSQTVGYGTNATFAVAATGIPDPTYQWLLHGTNLSGATGSTLTVAGLVANSGDYSVVVTTPAGSVTSSSATLVVNPVALSITASNVSKTYGQTVTFVGTEFTTSGLQPGDSVTSVTLTSAGGASSAAIGSYDIVPSAAIGTGLENYTIAYNNGTLTVSAATSPAAQSITISSGTVTLTFLGTAGTTYVTQSAIDLTGPWTNISTNIPGAGGVWTVPDSATANQKFYRALIP